MNVEKHAYTKHNLITVLARLKKKQRDNCCYSNNDVVNEDEQRWLIRGDIDVEKHTYINHTLNTYIRKYKICSFISKQKQSYNKKVM